MKKVRIDVEYHRKPRTININGVEVPEPEKEFLEEGKKYWLAIPTDLDLARKIIWKGDKYDLLWLERGFIHRTKEDAVAHAEALIEASGGEV